MYESIVYDGGLFVGVWLIGDCKLCVEARQILVSYLCEL